MAGGVGNQSYFGGLGQELLGKPPVFFPPGLATSLLQTPLPSVTSPSIPSMPAVAPDQKPPDSASGDHLTAAYFDGEDGNPFGHIGISVNSGPFYGFDPAPGFGALPLVGHEPGTLANKFNAINMIGSAVPGEVDMVSADRKPVDQVNIPVTSEQANQARQFMLNQSGPGIYNLPFKDCVTFGARALNAAGLQTPHSLSALFPADFVKGLHNIYDPTQQSSVNPR
ncbi:MAG TPA: hypothetical protein VFK21_00540 [Gammaproteobacteria bacterium]|nr:hypothetical protein [Gammaproteobacteria bacterium]